jgi:hypothetical protein
MPLLANINVGSAPNDGTGDSIRDSFITVNENFQFVEAFFPNTDVISLTANITSTGNSAFNNLTITGTTTSAGNISANYLFGNGSQLSAVVADTAIYVTGNAQSNITSVGTLTGLLVSGGITAATVSASTIGNTGATLIGTLSTAAQPTITSIGSLANLTVSGGNITITGSNRNIIGSRLTISSVVAIQRTGTADWQSNITAIDIDFGANISQLRGVAANANATVTWSNLSTGLRYDLYIKNNNGSTIYVTWPTNQNNKAATLIPITTGVTALFTTQTFDSTSANAVTTITNS